MDNNQQGKEGGVQQPAAAAAVTEAAGPEAPLVSDAKTCLLYTSPSPRDRTRSRMPSSA